MKIEDIKGIPFPYTGFARNPTGFESITINGRPISADIDLVGGGLLRPPGYFDNKNA